MVDAVDISNFRGIVPRGACAGLPANYARIANDVNLRRGCLEPWRTPRTVSEFEGPACRVHHALSCCWIGDCDPCTKYVDTQAQCTTFRSRPCEYPEYNKDTCKCGDWCRVGLPKPDAPAIAGGTVIDTEFTHARNYIITYCNACGEGPPSLPSNTVKANKGDPIIMELPDAPDGWCIEEIHIYRLMPIQDVNKQAYLHPEDGTNNQQVQLDQEVDADYFRVATLPVGTQSFVDSGSILCTERALLTTEDHLPLPEGACVVGETQSGSMIAFVPGERTLRFSLRNCHQAWPVHGRISFDDALCHACVCDNTVYVFTESYLFVMEDLEDENLPGCRVPRKIKCPLPLCSIDSVVKIDGGIIFASREGLVLLTSDGTYRLMTQSYFTNEDWNLLDPCTLRAARHGGSLHFTTDVGAWIMELDLNNGGGDIFNLTTSSIRADQYIEGRNGELFMLYNGTVHEWNAGCDFLPYEWEEAEQNICDAQTVTDAVVVIDDIARTQTSGCKLHFSLFNDLGLVTARTINHSRPFKIPSNYSSQTRISLCGDATVRRVKYGAGARCLKAIGGAQ